MTDQVEMFPKTRLEVAEAFLDHFQGDVDSAEKSLVNARVRLTAAKELRDMAEDNLRRVRDDEPEAPVVDLESGEVLDAMVIALYPTDQDGAGHPTPVGQYTLYGELVADYLTDAGLEDPIDDYEVLVAVTGDEAVAPGVRDLSAVIAPSDYGKRLLVAMTQDAVDARMAAATEAEA